MNSVELVSKQGRHYRVSLPEPKMNLRSAYIFAFARSGSTLLNDMVTAYCRFLEVPTFSLFNSAFDQGVGTHEIDSDALVCFKTSGYIYTGFRHFPAFDLDLASAPTIWLTRDPRDMLVSLYYSVLKSHNIPKGLAFFTRSREAANRLGIDQFVIRNAKTFADHFKRYRNKLADTDLKIYRYEDVIYKKEMWLTDVVTKLGLKYNQKLLENTVKHFDIIPKIEDDNKHIRQVHPGNHSKKLAHGTIQELNEYLSEFLEYFEYEH